MRIATPIRREVAREVTCAPVACRDVELIVIVCPLEPGLDAEESGRAHHQHSDQDDEPDCVAILQPDKARHEAFGDTANPSGDQRAPYIAHAAHDDDPERLDGEALAQPPTSRYARRP